MHTTNTTHSNGIYHVLASVKQGTIGIFANTVLGKVFIHRHGPTVLHTTCINLGTGTITNSYKYTYSPAQAAQHGIANTSLAQWQALQAYAKMANYRPVNPAQAHAQRIGQALRKAHYTA